MSFRRSRAWSEVKEGVVRFVIAVLGFCCCGVVLEKWRFPKE
jgi:hypothetical protein